MSDKDIAVRLSVSPKTVMTYWARLRRRLSVSSRVEAVATWLRLRTEGQTAEMESRLATQSERLRLIEQLASVGEAFSRATGSLAAGGHIGFLRISPELEVLTANAPMLGIPNDPSVKPEVSLPFRRLAPSLYAATREAIDTKATTIRDLTGSTEIAGVPLVVAATPEVGLDDAIRSVLIIIIPSPAVQQLASA